MGELSKTSTDIPDAATTQSVPDGWSVQSLGELTSWMSGGTPSKGNPEFWDGDISWISAKSLKSFYLYDSDDHVTDAAIADGARKVDVGDILMLVRGMTLHNDVPVGIAMRPMTFNQDVKGLRGKGDASTRYIAYWLVGNKWRLLAAVDQASHGTGRLRTEVVQAMDVLLPPPEEQEAIAAVLGSLDDKIEQNRRTARTLERLARAIFKAWFVDFEPMKAKAAGASSFPSMPQPTFDALPTTFTTTDHGPVPEGWDMGSLGDVIEIHDSRRVPLSKRQREERRGPYRYYGAAGVVDHVDGYLFDGCFTLVGEDGTVYGDGDRPMTQYVWGQFWVNNHAHVLTGLSPWTAEHVYVLLHHVYIRPFVTGAVQPKLNQGNLKSVPVVLPPDPVTIAFGEQIDPLFQMLRHIEDESTKLAAMRDCLLPQLLSGRVTVEATDA